MPDLDLDAIARDHPSCPDAPIIRVLCAEVWRLRARVAELESPFDLTGFDSAQVSEMEARDG